MSIGGGAPVESGTHPDVPWHRPPHHLAGMAQVFTGAERGDSSVDSDITWEG